MQRLVELPRVLTFRLTAAHLRQGEPRHERQCPVARALREIGVWPAHVSVSRSRLGRHLYIHEPSLKALIEQLDDGLPVHPGTFTMRHVSTCLICLEETSFAQLERALEAKNLAGAILSLAEQS